MLNHRNQKPLSFALIGCALLAASLASRAGETQSNTARAMPSHAHATPCDSARLAGWFQRQRELTDGNADPFQQPMVGDACGARAQRDAAPMAQDTDRAHVTSDASEPPKMAQR